MKSIVLLSALLLSAGLINAQTSNLPDSTSRPGLRVCRTGCLIYYYIEGVNLAPLSIGPENLGKFFTQPDGTVIISKEQLMVLPQRSINGVAGLIVGVDSRAGQIPNIRGARQDGTAYYIDGIRTREPEMVVIP